MSGTPRILTLDIETAPAHVLVFGQYKQNIANIQVIQPDRVIAFAAKWHGDKRVMFFSEYHDGKDAMIQAFWDLLNEADIVVHFNGKSFDMPWINREITLAGLPPYSPVQEIDLLLVARKRFRFMNNKLENLARMFGLPSLKMETGGFKLWRDIEIGTEDEQAKAWNKMRLYNRRDVVTTEHLYDRLLPWIPNHPHIGLYTGEDCCSNCGSTDLRREGYAYTLLGKYQRYVCRGCGRWGRGKKPMAMVDVRGVA